RRTWQQPHQGHGGPQRARYVDVEPRLPYDVDDGVGDLLRLDRLHPWGLDEPGRHLRLDAAGHHARDLDRRALATEFPAHGLAQPPQPVLRGRVRGGARKARVAGQRGHHDDVAGVTRAHPLEGDFDRVDATVEVDVDHS